MKIDIKSLLKNKTVLYIVLFLAITNVLGYLMTGNIWAVVLFALSGDLASPPQETIEKAIIKVNASCKIVRIVI